MSAPKPEFLTLSNGKKCMNLDGYYIDEDGAMMTGDIVHTNVKYMSTHMFIKLSDLFGTHDPIIDCRYTDHSIESRPDLCGCVKVKQSYHTCSACGSYVTQTYDYTPKKRERTSLGRRPMTICVPTEVIMTNRKRLINTARVEIAKH